MPRKFSLVPKRIVQSRNSSIQCQKKNQFSARKIQVNAEKTKISTKKKKKNPKKLKTELTESMEYLVRL